MLRRNACARCFFLAVSLLAAGGCSNNAAPTVVRYQSTSNSDSTDLILDARGFARVTFRLNDSRPLTVVLPVDPARVERLAAVLITLDRTASAEPVPPYGNGPVTLTFRRAGAAGTMTFRGGDSVRSPLVNGAIDEVKSLAALPIVEALAQQAEGDALRARGNLDDAVYAYDRAVQTLDDWIGDQAVRAGDIYDSPLNEVAGLARSNIHVTMDALRATATSRGDAGLGTKAALAALVFTWEHRSPRLLITRDGDTLFVTNAPQLESTGIHLVPVMAVDALRTISKAQPPG